jgi:hypothetical protein
VPQWLKLDLGGPRTINGVGIFSSVGRPLAFTISTSLDDVTYSQAATVRNATYALDWNVTTFGARDARHVVINITAAEQNLPYIYEVKVYPTAAPTPITPTAPTPTEEFPWLWVAVGIAAIIIIILLLSRRRIALWLSYVRAPREERPTRR